MYELPEKEQCTRDKRKEQTRSLLILYSFCGNSSLALYCFSGASSLVQYSFFDSLWEQKRDHSRMILCRCAARSCYDLQLRRGGGKGGAHWLKALSHSLGRKRGKGGAERQLSRAKAKQVKIIRQQPCVFFEKKILCYSSGHARLSSLSSLSLESLSYLS